MYQKAGRNASTSKNPEKTKRITNPKILKKIKEPIIQRKTELKNKNPFYPKTQKKTLKNPLSLKKPFPIPSEEPITHLKCVSLMNLESQSQL